MLYGICDVEIKGVKKRYGESIIALYRSGKYFAGGNSCGYNAYEGYTNVQVLAYYKIPNRRMLPAYVPRNINTAPIIMNKRVEKMYISSKFDEQIYEFNTDSEAIDFFLRCR